MGILDIVDKKNIDKEVALGHFAKMIHSVPGFSRAHVLKEDDNTICVSPNDEELHTYLMIDGSDLEEIKYATKLFPNLHITESLRIVNGVEKLCSENWFKHNRIADSIFLSAQCVDDIDFDTSHIVFFETNHITNTILNCDEIKFKENEEFPDFTTDVFTERLKSIRFDHSVLHRGHDTAQKMISQLEILNKTEWVPYNASFFARVARYMEDDKCAVYRFKDPTFSLTEFLRLPTNHMEEVTISMWEFDACFCKGDAIQKFEKQAMSKKWIHPVTRDGWTMIIRKHRADVFGV